MTTNLRAARRARNLSQDELGRLLGGTTQGAISRWERGERRPRRNVHDRLELALGRPLHELLADDETAADSKETTAARNTHDPRRSSTTTERRDV